MGTNNKYYNEIKAKAEFAQWIIGCHESINKAIKDIPPPFNLLAAGTLAKTYDKIKTQKWLEICNKYWIDDEKISKKR